MNKTFTYTGDNIRWLLSVDGQTVQVFCNGESRRYDIPEKITKVEQDTEYKEYVRIYVEDAEISFYQFKFEEAMFLVADIFDKNEEFHGGFACYVFGEDL